MVKLYGTTAQPEVYLSDDGISWEKVGKGTTVYFNPIAARYVRLNFSSASNAKMAEVGIYNYMSDEQKVNLDAEAIDINAGGYITENIMLPLIGANGSQITWSSSNTSVFSATGTVNRPDENTVVTLTAKITKGDAFVEKSYRVTVKGIVKQEGSRGSSSHGSGGVIGVVAVSEPQVKTDNNILFVDVPKDFWGTLYIDAFYKAGYITGDGAGRFEPERKITRAEFAKLVVESLGLKTEDLSSGFIDVPGNTWYYGYISALYKLNIIKGSDDGRFYPDQSISRQDMAVIAWRAAKTAGIRVKEDAKSNILDFQDVSDYALEAVTTLSSGNIISGFDNGSFSPFENTTRAQAVKVLYGLKYGNKEE